jgi:hypothetical protein
MGSLKMKDRFGWFQRVVFALLLVLSAAAAVFGAGYSYHRIITPNSSRGEFHYVDRDGWIENRTFFDFRSLSPRGNLMKIRFKDWHPPGAEPAKIQVFVCGQLASAFQVAPGKVYNTYLKGACNPRRVTFKILNPFHTAQDSRQLGAQIKSVSITSKLGIPIVGYRLLGSIFAAVFVLSLVCFMACRRSFFVVNVLFVPCVGFMALSKGRNLEFGNSLALWFFTLSLAFGFWCAGSFSDKVLHAKQTWLDPGRGGGAGIFSSIIILLIILGLGGVLRFYGIDFGLPSNYHPDEVPKYNAVMRMVAHGDLNPRYFLHPSLLLYSTYFTNNLLHSIGWFQGEWDSTLILAGRYMSAVAGTLSILFTFFIGKRLFSDRTGLIAAAVLAVMPLHITCSRYVKEDALLVAVILACVLALIKAVQDDRVDCFLLAGLLAGCSASVKYSGVLSAGIILFAPWLRSGSIIPNRRFLLWSLVALLYVVIGFIDCTPYSVLDSDLFLKHVGYEKSHMARGHTLSIDAWSQYWMYHFRRSIIPGMSLFTAIIAVMGAGLLFLRRRAGDLFLLFVIVLFYAAAEYVKAKPAPQPERYILPCLPFLAIAAGEFLRVLWGSRFMIAVPFLVFCAVFSPAYRSVNLASEVPADTRMKMEQWMVRNLPRGSRVYVDWKPYSPRFWNNEFEMVYLDRARIIPSLDISLLISSEPHYLLLSSLFYDRYFSQPKADLIARERIRDFFGRVPILKHVESKYGTYGFHNPAVTLFSLNRTDFDKLRHELQLKRAGRLNATSNERKMKFRWSVH